MTIKLLWTVLVSGAVIALGLSLVLRWLGTAGLPVPLASRTPDAVRYAVSRAEGLRVFLSALLFRLVIFVLVGLFTCLVLYPGSGPDAALWTWQRWDALHYVNLAELGYTGYMEDGKHLFLVFFPLYCPLALCSCCTDISPADKLCKWRLLCHSSTITTPITG